MINIKELKIKIKNFYLKRKAKKHRIFTALYGFKNIDPVPFEKIAWDMPITAEDIYNSLVYDKDIKYIDRASLFIRFLKYNQIDTAMKNIPIDVLIELVSNCNISKLRHKAQRISLPVLYKYWLEAWKA